MTPENPVCLTRREQLHHGGQYSPPFLCICIQNVSRKMRHFGHSKSRLCKRAGISIIPAFFFLPLLTFAADSRSNTSGMLLPQTESNYQIRPYEGRLEPDDGQWVRPAKDYASTRYSTLDQINGSNVQNLKLAFTFSTGLTHG